MSSVDSRSVSQLRAQVARAQGERGGQSGDAALSADMHAKVWAQCREFTLWSSLFSCSPNRGENSKGANGVAAAEQAGGRS
jgi:hypothetical protein